MTFNFNLTPRTAKFSSAFLSSASREVLANQLEQLDFLDTRLQRLEPIIQVRAARWPEVALLMTIRGIASFQNPPGHSGLRSNVVRIKPLLG